MCILMYPVCKDRNVATKASQGEEINASEDALVENPHTYTLDDLQLGENTRMYIFILKFRPSINASGNVSMSDVRGI